MSFELTQFELSLYAFQQFISRSLYINFYLKQPLFFLLLFLSGVFTVFNPCMFSMLPISLSYITSSDNKSINQFSFFLGLSSSSILFLVFFSILNYKYHSLFIVLPLISACIAVILGLYLLNILQVRPDINLPFISAMSNVYVRNYIWGFLLGINTSPCSTPILLTLLLVLSSSNDYLLIFFYMVIYLLGYMFPLLLFILLILQFRFVNNKLFSFTSSIFTSLIGCTVLSFGILRLLEKIFL
uniref:cytochrome c biogenesis protein transmembrane region n=1 Tax=Lithothamnion corallioides TaxID=1277934 RepID=UPI0023F0352B|nr:cytochrome c biogenesis protein transmembrane region [Lithothamnion corallioides]WEA76963.1 cytochrome c biogenesis protein transmembrane region [Lithothamnion corallioides]